MEAFFTMDTGAMMIPDLMSLDELMALVPPNEQQPAQPAVEAVEAVDLPDPASNDLMASAQFCPLLKQIAAMVREERTTSRVAAAAVRTVFGLDPLHRAELLSYSNSQFVRPRRGGPKVALADMRSGRQGIRELVHTSVPDPQARTRVQALVVYGLLARAACCQRAFDQAKLAASPTTDYTLDQFANTRNFRDSHQPHPDPDIATDHRGPVTGPARQDKLPFIVDQAIAGAPDLLAFILSVTVFILAQNLAQPEHEILFLKRYGMPVARGGPGLKNAAVRRAIVKRLQAESCPAYTGPPVHLCSAFADALLADLFYDNLIVQTFFS